MNPSQPTQGLNLSGYDYLPYSHTQPFIQQMTEDSHGQKRFISPEAQLMSQYSADKRIRHNSLEYVFDLNSQSVQPSFIRKVTLDDIMRGIDNLTTNTVKKEDLKDLATKNDLLTLEGSVKAQAAELHQLKSAFCKQQGEINSLRDSIDSNYAAMLAASDRSADREDVGHRMYNNNNGGAQSQPPRTQGSKRFNLVVEGIPDTDIDGIYAFVIELADSLEVILYKRDISNITRINRRPDSSGDRSKPGPCVVTFVHAHLRDAILRKKVALKKMEKYKMVYVNPDDTLDVRRQKARFRRIAYLARHDGHIVTYRADSIRIGETEYKVSELSSIPAKYIPKEDTRSVNTQGVQPPSTQDDDNAGMPALEGDPVAHKPEARVDEQEMQTSDPVKPSKPDNPDKPDKSPVFQDAGRTVLRGGRICFAGASSFLSNFFLVCFIFNSIKYQSLEQCYHHTHALLAKALEIAALIYKETDGVELKSLAKRIPFCAEWAIVSGPKMEEMLEAKFTQNPDLMDRLMRTAPYELVEASIDKKWGGGESWNSPKYDTGTFPGENRFGLKLTGYRDRKLALLNDPSSV